MDEKKNLPENILDIKKLDLWYGENHALKNVNMEIKRNAITAFIGPSGCGKSTFLKTLNRMNDLVPGVRIEGQVLLDGVDIYDPKVDTSMLRKKIGMVFQQPNPFPMSIYDNVAYVIRTLGISSKEINARVSGALKIVGLYDKMNATPSELSGGEQQRVGIARAIVNGPPLLIADEPTGNLDPKNSMEIMQILDQINQRGITVIVSTHDNAMVDYFRKRVITLDKGEIVRDIQAGTYE